MIVPRPFAAHGVGVGGRRGAPAGAEAVPCGRDTAFHKAVYHGHADATCALLIAGTTVGIKNKYGYGLRYWAGACGPKGHAPADAACSKTAEGYANERGNASAYADGVKRVRLTAYPQAQRRRRARVACMHVCGV